MFNFNSVLLGTDDPERLVAFYREILGEPGWEQDGYTGWQAGSGWITIGAHSDVKGQNEMPGRVIIGLETPEFEKEAQRVKELGVKVVAEPYEPMPGVWLATFEDPDGNYFQLGSPMPEDMFKQ